MVSTSLRTAKPSRGLREPQVLLPPAPLLRLLHLKHTDAFLEGGTQLWESGGASLVPTPVIWKVTSLTWASTIPLGK